MKPSRLSLLFVGIVFVLLLIVLVRFFETLPIEQGGIGIDWKAIYPGVQGGRINYDIYGFLVPPWAAIPLIPLGWFSLRVSWGLLAFSTLFILLLSVPRRRGWQLPAILLMCSHIAARQLVDGNVELLVIAGVLLLIIGYQRRRDSWLWVGLLLTTAKVQETWLLLLIVAIYLLQTRPLLQNVRLGLLLAAVVVPAFLLLGNQWLAAVRVLNPPPGSIQDSSLMAALGRIGLPDVLRFPIWIAILSIVIITWLRRPPTLSRESAGSLIAASLLLAPYSAANTWLTAYAIGVIPLWWSQRRVFWLFCALTNLPFLFTEDMRYWYSSYYYTLLFGLLTAYGVWFSWRSSRQPESSPVVVSNLV